MLFITLTIGSHILKRTGMRRIREPEGLDAGLRFRSKGPEMNSLVLESVRRNWNELAITGETSDPWEQIRTQGLSEPKATTKLAGDGEPPVWPTRQSKRA